MPARHITVTGRVQGVFFRAHTQEKAQELGLTGWVRNTENNGVEIHAEGPIDALDGLEQWCHNGPPGAQVESVKSEEVAPQEFTSFEVRY